MKRLFGLCGILMAAACQTPGYDYASRAAPNFPEALDYTDVGVGRFRGPAGDVAEAEFQALIDGAELQGIRWFNILDPIQPQGIYEGDVSITGYRRETRFERERRCTKLFNCDTRKVVEMQCPKDIVDVSVRATLVDMATGRAVFTSEQGGATEHEECYDIAEYPDTDQSTGSFGEVVHETFNRWDAPIGMVAEAVAAAVPGFRTDIAPYMTTLRAEIVEKPLVPEEAGDPRFAAAVKATRRGEYIGACAQWQELAAAYPKAPGILHNLAACAEARGDMEQAHLLYAQAAEIARGIPLLKDKDAKPIFDALSRISRGRYENGLIDQAKDQPGS
ncbi:tetratricopeptide repeat protein [Hyphomonas sp. WL0036]|uniref:tetratricopeptide repeat protein n=1 Tax=Hyphomonas sediminis TaxID=2866160 RepID=UPI001C824F7C|nr:tetratricopeptide repeat protein [Hyphomonas sediminis]MBY9066625.1 tetratricopeptide repeat protein [Hyphomonas sediminis]